MPSQILFEDIFEIRRLNPDGKIFEAVNRIHCRGTTYDVNLVLDYNSELFKLVAEDRVTLVLASSIALDGAPDDAEYNANVGPSLMDSFEYVMHGVIFNIEHTKKQNIAVHASFGGLIMRLEGEQAQLELLEPDMKFYILMRKGGGDGL